MSAIGVAHQRSSNGGLVLLPPLPVKADDFMIRATNYMSRGDAIAH
jgi:hypothetical protein